MMRELNELELSALMTYCISLARKSPPYVRAPHVGALVIDEAGTIIGRGYRDFLASTRFIQHAERMALDQAEDRARGATLITTLEPCIPVRDSILMSCSELIVKRGISTVIYGVNDNSPTVNNKRGIQFLEREGIQVFQYKGCNKAIQELVPYLQLRE